MSKITPYNTGKVQIGSLYQHRWVYTPSQDMERLQTALLGRPATLGEKVSSVLLATAIGVGMAWLLVAWWSS